MKTLTLIRRILLGMLALMLFAIPTVALIATTTSWDGICYGFTDGSWACPWREYFSNQLGYMALFSLTPLLCLGGLWLVLTLVSLLLKRNPKSDED
mgnify:CR=1 FL=1